MDEAIRVGSRCGLRQALDIAPAIAGLPFCPRHRVVVHSTRKGVLREESLGAGPTMLMFEFIDRMVNVMT